MRGTHVNASFPILKIIAKTNLKKKLEEICKILQLSSLDFSALILKEKENLDRTKSKFSSGDSGFFFFFAMGLISLT